MNIKKILSEIKYVYIGCDMDNMFEEVKYKFNPPASDEQFIEFEKKTSCILPEDFKEFLHICNGMQFMIGGELELYGTNEMISYHYEEYIDGVYCIGFCLDDNIMIKSDEIDTGKYIYVGDAYCSNEYVSLGMNFSEFLNFYIRANFSNYWRWGFRDCKMHNFYKF